jgi:hypothetical protein
LLSKSHSIENLPSTREFTKVLIRTRFNSFA